MTKTGRPRVESPRVSKTVRLDPQMAQKLEDIAEERGLSAGQLLDQLIGAALYPGQEDSIDGFFAISIGDMSAMLNKSGFYFTRAADFAVLMAVNSRAKALSHFVEALDALEAGDDPTSLAMLITDHART